MPRYTHILTVSNRPCRKVHLTYNLPANLEKKIIEWQRERLKPPYPPEPKMVRQWLLIALYSGIDEAITAEQWEPDPLEEEEEGQPGP